MNAYGWIVDAWIAAGSWEGNMNAVGDFRCHIVEIQSRKEAYSGVFSFFRDNGQVRIRELLTGKLIDAAFKLGDNPFVAHGIQRSAVDASLAGLRGLHNAPMLFKDLYYFFNF